MDLEKIKELRLRTASPFNECKIALESSGWDVEEAILYLRKLGVIKSAKKKDRAKSEGLVALYDGFGSLTPPFALVVNCETDFVAKNDRFREFVLRAVELAAEKRINDVQTLLSVPMDSFDSVGDAMANEIVVTGESIDIKTISTFDIKEPCISGVYGHGASHLYLGNVAAIVVLNIADGKLESLDGVAKEELHRLACDIAMHVVATKPVALKIEDVPLSTLEYERNAFAANVEQMGKTGDVAEKIVQGKIQKYYQESVLYEQVFIVDGLTPISLLLQQASDKFGVVVSIYGYKIIDITGEIIN